MRSIDQFKFDLNEIPEIAFNEFETQKYIINELQSMGYNPIKIAKTGVLLSIKGKYDYTICFRTDMDALPISEQKNKHMCGHDGHMSMLLELAKEIINKKLLFNLILLFQPAEETISGAKYIVEKKLLSMYNIKEIFALHLHPSFNKNKFYSKPNSIMCSSTEININIKGVPSHISEINKGVDTIKCSSFLVQEIYEELNVIDNIIFHIGKISSGNIRNQVSDNSKLECSLRVFNNKDYDIVINKIKNILLIADNKFKTKSSINIINKYPELINDEILFNSLCDQLSINKLRYPLFTAEDFAFYNIKKLFTFLGVKSDEIENYPLHHPKFNYNTSTLLIGVDYYLKIIDYYTKKIYRNNIICIETKNKCNLNS